MDLEERTLYYVPTTIKKPFGTEKLLKIALHYY